MNSKLARTVWSCTLGVAFASPVFAQSPHANEISTVTVATGLPAPGSIALHPDGTVYASSLFDANGNNLPTDIYRVLTDGTVETFTAPITDPDVLTLDAAGFVFVGSLGGEITRVDPADGSQTQWLKDTSLGNIDGLFWTSAGDLLVTAINKDEIFLVDGTTKNISEFADLDQLDVEGFGSILVDDSDGSVYAAAAKDGLVVKLQADGSLIDSAFVSGFEHIGQLALADGALYVSDNIGGKVWRVDLISKAMTLFVEDIEDTAGGLLHRGSGSFYATGQSDDLSDGHLYAIEPMDISVSGPPILNTSIDMLLSSPADAGRPLLLFISSSYQKLTFPDGRCLEVDFSSYILVPLAFGPSGTFTLPLDIPDHPLLDGFTAYFTAASTKAGTPGLFGISSAFDLTFEK